MPRLSYQQGISRDNGGKRYLVAESNRRRANPNSHVIQVTLVSVKNGVGQFQRTNGERRL